MANPTWQTEDGRVQLYLGDCLDIMPEMEDKSVDAVLCDLPYGITACKWDTVIPFEPLWKEYRRLVKDNSAIVLTASQPFTSALIMSNVKNFKFSWVWNKRFAGNFTLAKFMPMKIHEDVVVFSFNKTKYYPQMIKRNTPIKNGANSCNSEVAKFSQNSIKTNFKKVYEYKYPESIITYTRERGFHPTQKPIALFEYLIKTHTNQDDMVLDNCFGSGTTGVACVQTGRRFIGIEIEPKYFDIAKRRIQDALKEKRNELPFMKEVQGEIYG